MPPQNRQLRTSTVSHKQFFYTTFYSNPFEPNKKIKNPIILQSVFQTSTNAIIIDGPPNYTLINTTHQMMTLDPK